MEGAIGESVPGRLRLGGPVARALCAIATIGCCLVLAPVSAASASSFTWSGRSTTSGDWSLASNWEAEAPTASTEIELLAFPSLTSAACTTEQATHPWCYLSINNVGGLSAQAMKIDDGDKYFISGKTLTLGKGGLSAEPEGGSSGPASDVIEMPLQLGASQRWEIADRSGGGIEENGLFLGGEVTGSGNALTVELSNGPALILDNDTEVGPVTIEGPHATGERIANGTVLLGDGELNSSDRQAVDLRHVFFGGTGAVGALTTEGATLDVGSDTEPTEGLDASSAAFDPASGVVFEIMGTEMTAQADYSQLVSTGPIELAGALAVVVGKPTEKAPCPALVPGSTYTFISTTGKLTGTFADAPEGGPELPVSYASGCSQLSQTMRIAYNRSGSTETVTGTVEEEALNRKHHEEAVDKSAQEEAARIAEEAAARRRHEEEEAAAAAAKRHQEEATAKVVVLSIKESSPDVTITRTSLQATTTGAVSIKIKCPAGESSCAGTVTLRTLNAVIAGVAGEAKAKDAVLTLAHGSFSVPGGKVKTVTLHLSARARALLARTRTLRIRVTIVAHNPAGATHTSQIVATLHAPAAKHGKS